MFYLMIDTCVWLDVAKEPNQFYLIDTMEELVKEKKIKLLVPEIVIVEFDRNQERVSRENTQSFTAVVKRVKESIGKYGDKRKRKRIIEALETIPRPTDRATDRWTSVVRSEWRATAKCCRRRSPTPNKGHLLWKSKGRGQTSYEDRAFQLFERLVVREERASTRRLREGISRNRDILYWHCYAFDVPSFPRSLPQDKGD